MCTQSLCGIQLFSTPWTVAYQAPLSMAFPRQEYRSELPLPSPGALPYPGIQPESPALAGGFFTAEPPGQPHAPKSPNFRGKANKVRGDLQLIYSKRGGITHLLLEFFQKCHSIWQV